MKPAEFWAETPAELTDWIRVSSKHQAEAATVLAWQIGNLSKIGFHAPAKFPKLDQLIKSSSQAKPISREARLADAKLAALMAMPIDEAKVPDWAKEKKR